MPAALLFSRLMLRPLRREPARTALTLLAIALGVAVVLAIDLAGDAAAGSFRSSVETLAGDADFEVSAPGGLPASVAATLATLPYALRLRPRIEDSAEIVQTGHVVPLIGVDMIAEAPANEFGPPQDLGDLSTTMQVWIGGAFPHPASGTLELRINDRVVSLAIRGRLKGNTGEAAVIDLALADRLLHRFGALDRILIRMPKGETDLDAWQRRLRAALPSGVILERGGARTRENRKMLEAFRWNLRVLSYIALLVGAFLIYNTISVSVVRRRAEAGILRALGASRAAIGAAFLAESAAFGLAGSLLGILLGRLLALGAVKLVASTVESLYVSSTPAPITLTFSAALAALVLGTAVSILSGLAPALEASTVPPTEAMARGRVDYQSRVHKTRDLVLAALLALAALIGSRMPPVEGKPLFGYLAALLLVAAGSLAIPFLVSAFCNASGAPLGRFLGVEALLAGRGLAASLRRTSVLTAALAIAVAMMAAVGIMVGSFRETVSLWMQNQLKADLYLRPAGPESADRHPVMAASVADRIEQLPEVLAVNRFRAYAISFNGLPATLASTDMSIELRFGRLKFLGPVDREVIFRLIGQGNYAIVSEPFANKHHVAAGSTLTLSLGGDPVPLRILGVYYDYASERGYILLDRHVLLHYLPDPAPSNVAVYLKPGVPFDEGRSAVERAASSHGVLVIANRSLRDEAMRIFDRTFAITYALEAVAILVAVMGMAGALLALIIDRRRELGLLRFLGASASQIRRLILFEAGLLGLLANTIGLALGVLLSLILIYVINKQSFGWTIQFHWPAAVLLGSLTTVFLAAVLSGLYPARVAMRLNPIEAIHEE
jgi:putative ABC transport system permease protein